jgi:hypothetical protein
LSQRLNSKSGEGLNLSPSSSKNQWYPTARVFRDGYAHSNYDILAYLHLCTATRRP